MATTPPAPILYSFKEINPGKYHTVKHYELKEPKTPGPLSKQINIAVNRNFAKSRPDYWVKTRKGKTWSRNALTGLFKTPTPGIFYGDHDNKKHLLLFQFNRDASRVHVLYFKNFYTRKLQPVLNSLLSNGVPK